MATVLLAGDSHMEILGPVLARGLAAQGYTVETVFHRGWSVQDYLRSGELAGRGADLVVMELGTNDAAQGRDLDLLSADVRALVTSLGRVGRGVWVGPGVVERSDLAEAADEVADALAQAVPANGWTFLDSRPLMPSGTVDGVHYASGGYQRWAAQILATLPAPAAPSGRSWVKGVVAGVLVLAAWHGLRR